MSSGDSRSQRIGFAAGSRSLTVQLSDVNGPRGGVDKACLITAVLPGVGEIAVGERAETLTHGNRPGSPPAKKPDCGIRFQAEDP